MFFALYSVPVMLFFKGRMKAALLTPLFNPRLAVHRLLKAAIWSWCPTTCSLFTIHGDPWRLERITRPVWKWQSMKFFFFMQLNSSSRLLYFSNPHLAHYILCENALKEQFIILAPSADCNVNCNVSEIPLEEMLLPVWRYFLDYFKN